MAIGFKRGLKPAQEREKNSKGGKEKEEEIIVAQQPAVAPWHRDEARLPRLSNMHPSPDWLYSATDLH